MANSTGMNSVKNSAKMKDWNLDLSWANSTVKMIDYYSVSYSVKNSGSNLAKMMGMKKDLDLHWIK
jgi:hypothetical protein